ncbi:UNVERIFIED_CONTAM: 60S ribosomal protein L14 [Siphonaria sp. JEL0065]|nr:60S ribosomal protein L14 [Siphonaria sp. JEL0065]
MVGIDRLHYIKALPQKILLYNHPELHGNVVFIKIAVPSREDVLEYQNLDRVVYTRFVEVGRAVLVNYGPDAGKIAVIVDIVDHSRVLVDGPTTGVARQVLSYKRFSLTDIVVAVPRTAGTHAVKKALEKADVEGLWAKTSWAKKLAVRKVRQNLSDFDRFKLMIARKQKRAIIGKQFAKLRKAALKAGQL